MSVCWICMDGSLPEGDVWKRVCKCNLRAHERCIIAWGQRNPSTSLKCPQCQQPIIIGKKPSRILKLRDRCDAAVQRVIDSGIVGLVAPSILSSVTYNILYDIGSYAVWCMCDSQMSTAVLGSSRPQLFWIWPGVLRTPYANFYNNYDDYLRRVCVPVIPFWLVHSGTYGALAGAVPAVVVLSRYTGPWQSSVRTLVLLKPLYELAYEYIVNGYLKKLAAKVYDTSDEIDELIETVDRFMVAYDHDQVDRNIGLGNGVQLEPLDPEGTNIAFEERDDTEQEQEEREEEEGAMPNVERVRFREELVARGREEMQNRNAQSLLGKSTLTSRYIYPLLSPLLSMFAGKVLNLVPIFAKWSTFNRNILGLCLVVFLKDAVNVYLARKRAQVEISTCVLDYEEAQNYEEEEPSQENLPWALNFFGGLRLRVHFQNL